MYHESGTFVVQDTMWQQFYAGMLFMYWLTWDHKYFKNVF